jgi:hypothetical protein
MDLRRRPKRSASDAAPRILPLFRRGPPTVGSAVEGRDNGSPREALLVKEIMSSSARELAAIHPE